MSIESDVSDWLHSRPNWQQEAALRILETNKLTDDDFSYLAEYCKTDNSRKIDKNRPFSDLLGNSRKSNKAIRFLSISDIQGIDNLQPRKPLTIEKIDEDPSKKINDKNLVVIYGDNGSGKSGYGVAPLCPEKVPSNYFSS